MDTTQSAHNLRPQIPCGEPCYCHDAYEDHGATSLGIHTCVNAVRIGSTP
jgi:hypothetical protein